MIRSIIERTGVKIDVEDDGRVNVASAENSALKAISILQELTATPELNNLLKRACNNTVAEDERQNISARRLN